MPYKNMPPLTERVLICGGGIHNDDLLQFIRQSMPCPIESTKQQGIHPDDVETLAFAWVSQTNFEQSVRQS